MVKATTTPGDRLQALRIAAGYDKREPCARAIGIAPNTMAQHELGLREINRKRAEQYGRFFGVPATEILFGAQGSPESPAPAATLPKPAELARILRANLRPAQIDEFARYLLAVGKALSTRR
jgi:transcriptional regulator with XRE-family HTH domain